MQPFHICVPPCQSSPPTLLHLLLTHTDTSPSPIQCLPPCTKPGRVMSDRILPVKVTHFWKSQGWQGCFFPQLDFTSLWDDICCRFKSHFQQAGCLVYTLCFLTLLISSRQEESRRWEEIDRGGLKRRGMEGKKKKVGWEFKRSRAFDADREWKQLPWKPHPASNESTSKKKEQVNGGMRQSELLTKGICLICQTHRHI